MRPFVDLGFRTAYRIGFAAALVLWRLRRPTHHGALVAIRVGDQLLMVRQSYRRALSLPGGGVGRGEAPATAARRELVEELGLLVPPDGLRHVHTETGLWDGRIDTVDFFELALAAKPDVRVDRREVIEARFVSDVELTSSRLTAPARAYVDWAKEAISA